MQNLKRRTIRLLAVILSAVLGSLLILGEPASANHTLTQCLQPNTGYKLYRTEVERENPCYGETVYAKFTFEGEQFPGGEFKETYPIQDGWELHFNTPLSDGETGTLHVESECEVNVEKEQLQLLSGFKTKKEACDNTSGHFVIGKDYYAAIPKKGLDYKQCLKEGNHQDDEYCYEPLGSLGAITGNNFPALGGAGIGQLIIKPNAIRAPHWHLQFAEAGYCYEGIGQVGVIVPSQTIPKSKDGQEFYSEKIVEEMFVKNDEIFLFPESSQHYLRNIGNDDFACTLFFAEGTPLSRDRLLTISLQNIVGNTPLGVLGPMLVTDEKNQSLAYTSERVSQSPAQTYTSVDQGPDVIKVIEACSGEDPDYLHPGCNPPTRKECLASRLGLSVFSRMEP
ncbi:MAG: cupin domain-containing protein [Oscillatoria sp. SIO1A7]|nr:cupin domain-containing protein [Oscillatoria sp. SIO1A7]